MKATILVAAFMACWTNVYAEDCPPCTRFDAGAPNSPCGEINYGGVGCQCWKLGRDKHTYRLFAHKTGTKVEIDDNNRIHMWCTDKACIRKDYCKIHPNWRDLPDWGNDGDYELPAANGCCQLPANYISHATMYLMPY